MPAVKEKILKWLKEENLSPKEIPDPNAYFNFGISVGGHPFHVIQNVRSIDSIFVGANLVFTPEQLSMLKDNMNKNKRQEYFWDLRMALLINNNLGDFQIKPNPPNEIREVFVSSKRIFYEALTKSTLIHAISSVFRATMMVIWMLERKAGVSPKPRRKKTSQYVA